MNIALVTGSSGLIGGEAVEFFADKSFKRKFLDRLIFNYNSTHLNLLLDYEKLLKERTLVLKQNISPPIPISDAFITRLTAS